MGCNCCTKIVVGPIIIKYLCIAVIRHYFSGSFLPVGLMPLVTSDDYKNEDSTLKKGLG